MNLENLKPAWRRFQLLNAMQSMDQHEILLMLDAAEGTTISKTTRYVMGVVMLIVLTFCSQGG
jgi:hypothetical protein